MAQIKAVKKEIKGGLFKKGTHVASITSIVEDTPTGKDNNPWDDVTEQTKITFKNDTGMINAWFNKLGYSNRTDFEDGIAPEGHSFQSSPNNNEEYLVEDESNCRVVSKERTDDALRILAEFVTEAMPEMEGEAFDTDDLAFLMDAKVGLQIEIREKTQKPFVHYFQTAEEATTKLEAVEA
jgi:hypothetical protein